MRFVVFIFFAVFFSPFASATKWTPFTLENGHVKIKVKVAGIETFALLDSGAQVNAINKAFIGKHGLSFDPGSKIKLQGVFGTETVTQLDNVPVEMFGAEFELDDISPVNIGYHTTGMLLGAGFFSSFIVQIDYPNKRIRFMPRKSIKLTDFKNIQMVSQRGSGKPLVRISVNQGNGFWVLLDTGNSGGVFIERPLAESMGLTELATEQSLSSGVNSMGATESVRVDELQFGPYTLEQVKISMPAEGQGANLDDQTATPTGTRIRSKRQRGILGYDVLKHFVLTIDYKNGNAHIGLPN